MTAIAAWSTMTSNKEVTVSTQPLVLVADDEPRITKLVSIALGEEGFRVVTATSGEEALAKAEEVRPDIVLLDIVMPDLDGIEEIEHGEVLHGKHFVHALETQPALAVEEVGDVRLLEPCLFGQPQPGKVSVFNPVPEGLAQVFLQSAEFHGQSIALLIAL